MGGLTLAETGVKNMSKKQDYSHNVVPVSASQELTRNVKKDFTAEDVEAMFAAIASNDLIPLLVLAKWVGIEIIEWSFL